MNKKVFVKSKKPKAVYGALIGTGLSLVSNLIGQNKAKEEQQKAEMQAMLLAKSNNMAQDKIRLADFQEEGNGIIDYYAKNGGKIDPRKTKEEYERPVTDAEADANAATSQFTSEGIKMLGFVKEYEDLPKSKINYGKYTGMGYFNEQPNGEAISLSPSKRNARNAYDFKASVDYVRKLNPDLIINDNGYVDIKDRKEKGGKLMAPSYSSTGGTLQPLSSDTELVKGRKHSQGGVDLLDDNGKPFVEVEKDETIKDGTKVYSDSLKFVNGKTYAENSEMLARKKAKIEQDITKGDSITNFTNKRKLASLDNKENLLFAHQEISKVNTNKSVTKAKNGMDLDQPEDNFLTKAAPYIDNVANAVLTLNTPKLATPVLQKQVPLKTTVNVQPQLNDVTNAVESAATNIKNNTSNSAVARNEITAARLQGSRQKAQINANKQNVETNLYNANVQNSQNISARNLAAINNYNQMNVMRTNDIQKRISDNVANLSNDIIEQRNFEAGQRYNQERLDIASNMYQKDTTRRALLNNPTEIMLMKNNPDYAQKVLERFKGTKEEEELRRLLGIPLATSVGLANPRISSISTINPSTTLANIN